MIQGQEIVVPDPQYFFESLQPFTYQEKYFKWVAYLKTVKQSNSQYYQASLEKFVELFPFNHTYWAELLDLILSKPKGKANTLKMYQVALAKNPRCITLWKKYLDWLKKQLTKSDPNYLRGQLQNASKMIGNHYQAGFVFEYYIEFQKNVQKQFTMLKKAMVSPISDIDRLKQKFLLLIDSEQFLPYTFQIAEAEGLSVQQFNQNCLQHQRILQQEIKQRIILKLYQPTRQHVQERSVFESKVSTDEYIPYTDSIENWRNYIAFIKQSGNSQFLPSIYQRALISQCDNQALWEEYFLLLDIENNHQRALYLLRSHALFFRNMSKQLTYYWLEIEERDNPSHARELYLEMQKTEYDLEIFMRHISMQIRSKDFANAKAIFEAVLTIFSSNLSIVVYTVIEYAEFSVKNFRDIGLAKKLLHNYFKSYPFDETLFISLLQFFQKNIEVKENTKQGKQISDQFIEIILLGLKKALNCYNEKQYERIKKVACHHLRSYVLSIYLIKIADRRIKQQQLLAKKEQENERRPLLDGIDGNANKKLHM